MAAQQPLRCLITGANTGLGFEVAKQLLLRGYQVILACRDPQKAQQATQQLNSILQQQQQQGASILPQGASILPPQQQQQQQGASILPPQQPPSSIRVSSVQCDLGSFDSVKACAADVAAKWPHLDLLVCNAAVIPTQMTLTEDGFETQMQVNHLSHFLLTHLLLPSLVAAADARTAAAAAADAAAAAAGGGAGAEDPAQQQQHQQQQQGPASSRVVVVGSLHHAKLPADVADAAKLQQLMSGQVALPSMQMYGLTKLCNVWFARHLAQHVLAATGGRVVANVVTPGFVPNTSLSRHTAGNLLSRLFMRYVMPWAPFAVTVQEGGRRVVSVCLGDAEGRVSGQFFSKGQVAQPSAAAADEAQATECWRVSCEATGVPLNTYGGLRVAE